MAKTLTFKIVKMITIIHISNDFNMYTNVYYLSYILKIIFDTLTYYNYKLEIML